MAISPSATTDSRRRCTPPPGAGIVRKALATGGASDAAAISAQLVEEAYIRGSSDNITAIVVVFTGVDSGSSGSSGTGGSSSSADAVGSAAGTA